MAKLIAFAGLDGERVWINPSHVVCVKSEGGRAVVHLTGNDPRPVTVAGEPDTVAKTINDNMGWWL